MLIGLHHVGRAVVDLQGATDDLAAVSGWPIAVDDPSWRPLVAGRDVTATAMGAGPNGWIELCAVDGPAGSRREVHEPGVTHAALFTDRIERLVERLDTAGVARHPGPVELGTGFQYLYVRDREHLVTEVESSPQVPDDLGAWLVHGAIATPDIEPMLDAYERLLGTSIRGPVRVRDNAEFTRGTELADADATVGWVRGPNARVEFWQFHEPATTGRADQDYETPGASHLAFETDDLHADFERAGRCGFSPADAPQTSAGVGVARLRDPDGNWIELIGFDDPTDQRSLAQRTELQSGWRADVMRELATK